MAEPLQKAYLKNKVVWRENNPQISDSLLTLTQP